jgi:tRNA (cmo5U34)-methyltransferase
MASNIPSSRVFDPDAQDYDRLRRGLVPCFDGFYGTALDLIARWHRADDARSLHALDLGAGTGLFSSLLLERVPQARIDLFDGSAAMLDQAKARFSGRADFGYRIGDMADAELGGPYDLVISALAIHHLSDEDKQGLFARILAALRPGGLFVNAEQVLGPTPEAEARYGAVWREQAGANGISPGEIEAAEIRMRTDRCAPLEDQLVWLRQAGFEDVDCSFKAWRFAVYAGARPAQT